MGARPGREGQIEGVTTHEPAGWMHDDVVADAVALGVQALQNAQRPRVCKTRDGLFRLQGVINVQGRVPAHASKFNVALKSSVAINSIAAYAHSVWAPATIFLKFSLL